MIGLDSRGAGASNPFVGGSPPDPAGRLTAAPQIFRDDKKKQATLVLSLPASISQLKALPCEYAR
jgi:hypothetical protein